ncbi:MAG: ATP-binding cassette domain-containing protein [Bowdeniella nasicola]|nr:ATP-binding cassette domain-containing protein [Bowdeniella nasicola]
MITLRDVSKIYDGVAALADVSLHVPRGTIHGIVGPSGAGKSTLVGCLTGLVTPSTGSVVVDDVEVSAVSAKKRRELRRRIGMVFQHVNLFDQSTAAANIAYPLRIMGTPRSEITTRVAELLDIVGLSDRGGAYPAELSGGQRQRVGIARALATHPPVLLADEATSALDTVTTSQILQLLRDVRDQLDVTVVLVTHEMSVVREVCDSATMLSAGNVVQSGTLAEIVSDPTSPLARALVPLPHLSPSDITADHVVLDVMFTSQPGEPTGARVLGEVAACDRLGQHIGEVRLSGAAGAVVGARHGPIVTHP